MIFFCVLVLSLAALARSQECKNRKCRNNDCFASEYQDDKCTNGTRKCCDKQCEAVSTSTCGSSLGCFVTTTRTITTPGGKYRTDGCANSVSESATPCATNCANCVESWAEWGACSVSCGLGSQSRARQYGGGPVGRGRACVLPATSSRTPCSPAPPPCPVPCTVGPWSQWSPCNGACSPAQHQRVRNLITAAMFGGSCVLLSEIGECPGLMPCDGSSVVATPFPTPIPATTAPTSPPLSLPSSTFIIYNDQLVGATEFDKKPNRISIPHSLGALLAVLVASSDGAAPITDSPFLTSANHSLGCQIETSTGSVAGEILAPTALRFEFDAPRAFARVVLSGVSEGESARLVGFDRDSRKRIVSELVLDLQASDQSFADNVGFDTWELRPSAGSSIGLQTIEVFATVAALPTVATTAPPLDASGGETTSATDSDNGALAPSDVTDADNTTLIIGLCVGFALLAVVCLFVFWVARRRSRAREHEAVRHFADPRSFSALNRNSNVNHNSNIHSEGVSSNFENELQPIPSSYASVPRQSQVAQAAPIDSPSFARYESARFVQPEHEKLVIDRAQAGYRDFLVATPAHIGTQYGVGDLTHEVGEPSQRYEAAPSL